MLGVNHYESSYIPMKIQKLETFTSPYVSFVKVTTDDGMSGIGQMSTYHADITAQVFHRQVAPWVLGKSIAGAHHDQDDGDARIVFADLAARVTEREHKFPGSYIYRALAGLDTALWDLVATAAEIPVTAMIGGKSGTLRAYASSMKRDISPADEAARFCQLRDDKGFDAFKFRVGAECGRGMDEWPGRTEEIIPTVTAALGDGIVKMVDANSCFGVKRAIEVGHMLQDHGVTHYEEPCPYWHPDDTLQVTNALAIDVTGGEQDCDMRVWKDMIDRRIVNIVQPDVMYMGGVTPWLQVADMADKAGLICTPHAANLSLVTICTMHVLQAIPNAGPYLELSIEGADYYPWQDGLFLGDPFKVTDGHVTISDAPGWGVEVNPDWLATADYAVSAVGG
jgi:L-alanine-DL-glutamate epimerase-like enolase superfamily enzyme